LADLPYIGTTITGPSGNDSNDFELKVGKGAPNGYAPLDANAKVPTANIPDQASLDAEVDAKITTHNSATTSVHGIANTANLSLVGHTHAIPDVTNLQTTLDTKSPLAGVQWTARHTTSTGNQYAVGSIVYHNGRVYRCTAENDSMPPQQGSDYWADLGVGYLLPNENPKIQGGTIETSGGASIVLKSGTSGDEDGGNGGSILQVGGNAANGLVQTGEDENGDPIYENIDQAGGNAGYIWQNGASGGDYGEGGSAGFIDTSAYDGNSGGSINTGAGEQGNGGVINLSNDGGSIRMYGGSGQSGGSITTWGGGGSIDTRGQGSIQFGQLGRRTTLNGSVVQNTGDKTITLPNETGTIALTTHTHGRISSDGKLYSGAILGLADDSESAEKWISLAVGTYQIIQAGGSGGVVQITGVGQGDITNGGSGYTNGRVTIGPITMIASVANYEQNLPIITGPNGIVATGSFGTTANTFCQGNDSRLSNSRAPTAHTHAISQVTNLQATLTAFAIALG
jgi:hypothetical protein